MENDPVIYGDIVILYEDNHLLVVNKPGNMLSQGDRTGDDDIQSLLKQYLKEKYQKPGNVFLALVQRLDRGTSGVMVLARTSKAAARLSDQIRKRSVRKHYLAVAETRDVRSGIFTHYLKKDESRKKANVSDKPIPDGQKAILEIEHLQSQKSLSLVGITLQTGRFHQIRAQLAELGMPLYGDRKYGATSRPDEPPALICNELSFQHPIRGETMSFTIDPPNHEPWNLFSRVTDLR